MDPGDLAGNIQILPNFPLLLAVINTPPIGVVISFFVVLLLIGCSAIMSASEVAFFSISNAEKEELKDSDEASDKKLFRILSKPKYLLSTILLVNNLVNIGVIVISYYIISNVFNFHDIDFRFFVLPKEGFEFMVNIFVVTFFLVLFGEAIPKVYATHNKMGVANGVLPIFSFLIKVFFPVNYLLVNSTSVIEKRIKRHSAEIDIEEINKAIEITVENKESRNDIKMLKGIVHFGNTTVKQVMKPRTAVAAVDAEWNFDELLKFVKEHGYSRLPVFRESLDNIVGVLYLKDILEHIHQKDNFGWIKLVREALHTPETKKIDDLLREFQATKKHLAIVVDEFGGTSGIVTLEDIVEEVVGDIKDESDETFENLIRKNTDGSYIVEAIIPLNELSTAFELPVDYFDDHKGDSETLSGLILEQIGRIPKSGDEIELLSFKLKVLSFKNNRIDKVKLSRK